VNTSSLFGVSLQGNQSLHNHLPASEIKQNFRLHLDIPNAKTPKSIQEMGHYSSTMAISTGFTGLLQCEQFIFQYQILVFDVKPITTFGRNPGAG
jgi:hypothetical protein